MRLTVCAIVVFSAAVAFANVEYIPVPVPTDEFVAEHVTEIEPGEKRIDFCYPDNTVTIRYPPIVLEHDRVTRRSVRCLADADLSVHPPRYSHECRFVAEVGAFVWNGNPSDAVLLDRVSAVDARRAAKAAMRVLSNDSWTAKMRIDRIERAGDEHFLVYATRCRCKARILLTGRPQRQVREAPLAFVDRFLVGDCIRH